eukprot:gnl/TRDRNA2_/TRDRNA2_132034_c1_seq1.p2 gnl/TRDRNA2_/TRDRNA2_132034_c1~~gnl/TRDRNA2_/TRDRNA2_132034_c1_seq1.p2  ORF type:complete len:111 (-),score=1.92 gnl/TRDRNA2_/TRDRNA2_132034_c1_seq1:116-448(-)
MCLSLVIARAVSAARLLRVSPTSSKVAKTRLATIVLEIHNVCKDPSYDRRIWVGIFRLSRFKNNEMDDSTGCFFCANHKRTLKLVAGTEIEPSASKNPAMYSQLVTTPAG